MPARPPLRRARASQQRPHEKPCAALPLPGARFSEDWGEDLLPGRCEAWGSGSGPRGAGGLGPCVSRPEPLGGPPQTLGPFGGSWLWRLLTAPRLGDCLQVPLTLGPPLSTLSLEECSGYGQQGSGTGSRAEWSSGPQCSAAPYQHVASL